MNRIMLGKRLKEARNAVGMTAETLAEICDLNPTYIRHIECGIRTPSLSVFISFCNALKVSPTYLLQDQLENTELDELNEFADLWHRATPSQQQMVLSMLRAALASLPE